MIVLKFGGAALADTDSIKNAASYIRNVHDKKPIVVVSAMGGVTDLLITTIADAVSDKRKNVLSDLRMLRGKHEKAASDLIKSSELKNETSGYLDDNFLELQSLFKSISVLKECSPKTYDYILSFGEKLCSKIVANVLLDQNIPAEQITGEELIVTDSNFGYAYPDFPLSEKKIQDRMHMLPNSGIPIVTGFIGATEKGETTTLGRGGSDFTASILAYCLDAKEVWFLKEVDGIMTADPGMVTNARTIEQMSYEEVAELSYLGAKVLHPIAIQPLKEKQIPSFIKNVHRRGLGGTAVTNNEIEDGKSARAITHIKDVSIITVQGKGMIGVPGIAGRAATSLAGSNINIIMISQTSSEQNICFVINRDQQEKAVNTLSREFELEIIKKTIGPITAEDNVSILSVIGSGLMNKPGVAGRIFSTLGRDNINVKLIAQGSSEFNVSFVIDSQRVGKALTSLHDEFNLGGQSETYN